MAWKQLRSPDLSVKGYAGLCLNYARRVYHVAPRYANAWQAWSNSKQHKTRTLPKTSVPLWFSYVRYGVNLGHVVVYVPGKGLYSSPIAGGRTKFSSLAELERLVSNIHYVGWSEDINKVAVVKPVPSPAPTPIYHVVRKGETLGGIAKRYGTTYQKLQILNKKVYPSLASNPDFIKVGWKLKVR